MGSKTLGQATVILVLGLLLAVVNDAAATEIYSVSVLDAVPIGGRRFPYAVAGTV